MPDWAKHLSKSGISALLDGHIDEVVGRYAGHVHFWDVVNEPICPDHNNVNGLRGGPWFAALGPDYIERSFRRARQVDPHAKLVLNLAGIEDSPPSGSRRRHYLLQLIKHLLDKDAPLDAIDFKSHLWSPADHDRSLFLEFTQSIQKLGLDIYITELDVSDSEFPDDISIRDRAVTDCYRRYILDATNFPPVKVIVTWELSAKYSWRADGIRSGRAPTARWPKTLPFDISKQPKLAYQAITDALSKA